MGVIKFSTKIFAASKILHYLCIAMLEVTIAAMRRYEIYSHC